MSGYWRLLGAATLRRTPGIASSGRGLGVSRLAQRQQRRFFLPWLALPWLALQAGGDGVLPSTGYLKPNVCYVCTAGDHSVSYEELKKLLKSKAIFLIDVREKSEIEQYGKIPGSVNIPSGEIVEALQMDPANFKETYNQDMPSKSDHVVFSCMAGVRSSQALAAAKSLGFKKAQHFAGGFEEWAMYESSGKD
uniref:Rhodanese domain-containing protein n=1 Tax=Salvator merianae TaxID=96440 RepID=A0A8D0DQX0_SALMN